MMSHDKKKTILWFCLKDLCRLLGRTAAAAVNSFGRGGVFLSVKLCQLSTEVSVSILSTFNGVSSALGVARFGFSTEFLFNAGTVHLTAQSLQCSRHTTGCDDV